MAASICFVSLSSYGLLSAEDRVRHVGGAEVQQALIARELASRGHRVSFVVFDHGQPDGQELGGIRAFKAYPSDAGVRFLRFFHPRLTGLWSALARAGADVYYQRGAGSETGLVGVWCRLRGKRFVFAAAHDADCDPRLPLLGGPIERTLYRVGLRCAQAILAQTEDQRASLLRCFGLSSTIVRSACTLPPASENPPPPESAERSDVLWVGRLSPEKRAEWLVDLARDLGTVSFAVVGQSNAGSAYGQGLESHLRALPNVAFHGYVPHSEMWPLYRRSRVLLCTSEGEGFPNVFLEAWACGVPVLSTVDPGGTIRRHGLGELGVTREELKAALTGLRKNGNRWLKHGRRGRVYVQEHHTPGAVVGDLQAIIERLLPRPV